MVTSLVLEEEGKLKLIKGSRNMDVPSHILYVDDFMLFCKASNSNVQALIHLASGYPTFKIFASLEMLSWNLKRFDDKSIHVKTTINEVIASVSLTGSISKFHANSSMSEFVILKALHVQMQFSKAPVIKEVLWQPPILNWMKCNSDGASTGNPGNSSFGGIFRNSEAIFKGAFAINLGIQSLSLCWTYGCYDCY
ncbi:ribonuclease H protein [Trifolium medium]|uniref:Ribonuclease H protein n=1 Tax=Trifolium medium TaxID=97028 RepID=A0A392NAE8_9FABA|nr:ribonuclease H protein [Trifolium medium]